MNIDDWNMLDENDNPPSRKKQRGNPCLKEGSKLCPFSQQVVFLVRGVILLSWVVGLLGCKSNYSEIWDFACSEYEYVFLKQNWKVKVVPSRVYWYKTLKRTFLVMEIQIWRHKVWRMSLPLPRSSPTYRGTPWLATICSATMQRLWCWTKETYNWCLTLMAIAVFLGHMIAISALGNPFAFMMGCQALRDHVITICSLPCWLL